MLGRLLSKLFSRKSAAPSGAGSRPVSPPPPAVPLAAPPPPPPPQGHGSAAAPARPVPEASDQVTSPAEEREQVASAPAAAVEPPAVETAATVDPLDLSQPLVPAPDDVPAVPSDRASVAPEEGAGPGGVRLILEDGTLAKPSLDPELEERLRYIVDNIVPPSTEPSDGPST